MTKDELLAARYGANAIPAAGPWNDTIAVLLQHRSIRGYRSDPLPPGTLETLIAAAQSAATSSNMQTWSVIAVSDPRIKADIAKCSQEQKQIEQCPLFLAWIADLSRAERLGRTEGVKLDALRFFETFLVASIDAALAAQNAVVAAESLGLSTVYIGAMRNDVRRIAEILALPKGTLGVFGLCVGYADPDAPSEIKPRLAQGAILHRERYRVPDEAALRRDYDAKLAAFSKRNEMVNDTWTERVKSRLGSAAALRGRDRLRAHLNELGFPLD